MKVPLPSFEKCEHTPKLAAATGVAIAMPADVDLASDRTLPVYGAFQLSRGEMAKLPAPDVFRALVMLLIDTSVHNPYSGSVAGNAIMLETTPGAGDRVMGFFNVDAFAVVKQAPRPGKYFLSVYLDQWHSKSLPITVKGPAGRGPR